ncbi:MAG: S-layer protein, partial [Candidatus Altiarchaeota archaeon]|nr:S-layer protein [Candidatus Altiarchaeota archaeon]
MLGAALSSAVSAGLDATGLSKGFFYDANYNPIAQIVVGQNGLAPDSVAAGNIAAVIGNLAYSSKQSTIALDPTAQGRVVLGVSARGASGKYEQADTDVDGEALITYETDGDYSDTGLSSFYKKSEGVNWTTSGNQIYEKGEFVTYSLSCETQRTDAGILKEATYNNIHCLFCETLCLEQLENPEHTMSESIFVDWGAMRWYEDG